MLTQFSDIRWLFFDVGSTLVDERACYRYRLEQVALAAGLPYEEIYAQAIAYYRQNQKGDLMLCKEYGVSPPWQHGLEKLYPDAKECLETLHRQYHIGIIANQERGTEERLRAYGIMDQIDLVISSAEEGGQKPDPRIFALALKRAGCDPSRAVMIGDRVDNDIVPAKRIGMKTVRVLQGFGQYWQLQGEEEQADLTVGSLQELCDIFCQ